MKRIALALFAFVGLMAASCQQDPLENVEPPKMVYGDLTRNEVTLTGWYIDNGSITDWGFEMSLDGTDWSLVAKNPMKDEKNRFSYHIDGLKSATAYSFRSFIGQDGYFKYSATNTLTTLAKAEPRLSDPVIEKDIASAVILDYGGREITSVGFYVSESQDVEVIRSQGRRLEAALHGDGKTFSVRLTSFEPGKTYWIVAFAENTERGATYQGHSRSAVPVAVTSEFAVDFEDPVFANYLIDRYDDNRDGRLSHAELAGINSIEINTDNVTSLNGIGMMPNLCMLDCRGSSPGSGRLETLDLSRNANLLVLLCDNNLLTSLDISNNPLLYKLCCTGNRISDISLMKNHELLILDVKGNPLVNLDISRCTQMQTLYATGCSQLGVIYVWPGFKVPEYWDFHKEASTAYEFSRTAPIPLPDPSFKAYCLERLDADHDSEISIAEVEQVEELGVCTEYIASLEGIEWFAGLKVLRCYGSESAAGIAERNGKLTSLDLSENKALEILVCIDNPLIKLDLSANTALANLVCDNCLLKTIDISQCRQLVSLSCCYNQLTALDVTGCPELEELNCSNNLLSTLDLSANTKLQALWCESNLLASLDLSSNVALSRLDCYGNRLEVLDLTKNLELVDLECYENPLKAVFLLTGQVIASAHIPSGTEIIYLGE